MVGYLTPRAKLVKLGIIEICTTVILAALLLISMEQKSSPWDILFESIDMLDYQTSSRQYAYIRTLLIS